MEVTPKTLREVEFREKMRGYHPEDVDHFLEQVAAGIESLQDRLRQALERLQRAESAASEAGGADDTLRKTLVLAQRTADMAVQEAREQASRILAAAEQQAQSIIAEAEERGRQTLEDTIAEARNELSRLETARAQAHSDVETLHRWIEEHRSHLQASLSQALDAVQGAGVLWPAPQTARATEPEPELQGAVAEMPARRPVAADEVPADPGPDTMMWSPTDEERDQMGGRPDPVDEALDNFFDDPVEAGDEHRLGGRLRRRR